MALKLSYFPFPGRAFVTRVCLGAAGVEYANDIVSFAELKEKRETPEGKALFPQSQLPVLTVGDKVFTQSGAHMRFG